MHPTLGSSQYKRQSLTGIRGEIDSKTVIVGEFNIPLIPIDR